MQVRAVDERDVTWEVDDVTFRVFVFAGPANETSCYDITGAQMLDVLGWAQRRCRSGERYAVALVHDEARHHGSTERGLVWLLGVEPHRSTSSGSTSDRLRAMWDRVGRTVVVEG